jgi:4-hydroxybenzoate polyprenyltransferase
MHRPLAYLRLMRPANIVTAVADILAGFAASGAVFYPFISEGNVHVTQPQALGWLVLSTIGLYGGGVVFNDVFDVKLDRVERPERPIPSGLASQLGAAILGSVLLLVGILAALQVSILSGILALTVAILALVYDSIGKHHPVLGPLNMGACRGGNLLLGVSALPIMVGPLWFLALIPVAYIAAITMISRGEVHGGSRGALRGAAVVYGLVLLTLLAVGYLFPGGFWSMIPFWVLFAFLIFPPLIRANENPEPTRIRSAVRAGILALIVMNATLAAAFAGWIYGLVVLALLPLSIFLAKKFAVT